MYAYKVNIQPSGCPRKINREIVKTMVEGYSQVWRTSEGPLLPVYDGREGLFTASPVPSLGEEKDRLKLEVTLAGADGRER